MVTGLFTVGCTCCGTGATRTQDQNSPLIPPGDDRYAQIGWAAAGLALRGVGLLVGALSTRRVASTIFPAAEAVKFTGLDGDSAFAMFYLRQDRPLPIT